MQLVDIGANLTHSSFRHDLAQVLDRARAHGVAQMIVTGASREGSPDALALARAHPGLLYATAGVHPHHAAEYDAETDALLRDAVGACAVEHLRKIVTKRGVGQVGADVDQLHEARRGKEADYPPLSRACGDRGIAAKFIGNSCVRNHAAGGSSALWTNPAARGGLRKF